MAGLGVNKGHEGGQGCFAHAAFAGDGYFGHSTPNLSRSKNLIILRLQAPIDQGDDFVGAFFQKRLFMRPALPRPDILDLLKGLDLFGHLSFDKVAGNVHQRIAIIGVEAHAGQARVVVV
jgi:hypothetical protein